MKFRPKTQTILKDKQVKAYHCIEVYSNRKWTLLGDDNGIYKFESAAERDNFLENLTREYNQ